MPSPFDYPSMGSQVSAAAQLGNIGGGDPLLQQLLQLFFQSRGMQFPGQGQMGGPVTAPPMPPAPAQPPGGYLGPPVQEQYLRQERMPQMPQPGPLPNIQDQFLRQPPVPQPAPLPLPGPLPNIQQQYLRQPAPMPAPLPLPGPLPNIQQQYLRQPMPMPLPGPLPNVQQQYLRQPAPAPQPGPLQNIQPQFLRRGY